MAKKDNINAAWECLIDAREAVGEVIRCNESMTSEDRFQAEKVQIRIQEAMKELFKLKEMTL